MDENMKPFYGYKRYARYLRLTTILPISGYVMTQENIQK